MIDDHCIYVIMGNYIDYIGGWTVCWRPTLEDARLVRNVLQIAVDKAYRTISTDNILDIPTPIDGDVNSRHCHRRPIIYTIVKLSEDGNISTSQVS